MENLEVKIHSSGELWYVYIYDITTSKIVKKFYKGINTTDDLEDRMLRCYGLRAALEKELKNGWKPITGKSLPNPYAQYLSVEDAYNRALSLFEKSDVAEGTKKEYRSHNHLFLKAVKSLKWESHQFRDLEPYHITKIIEKLIEQRKPTFPNSFYNKHLGILKSHYKILQNNFIIKENRALGMPERKHKKKQRDLLTPEEQTLIINHFKIVCQQFVLFLKVLYHLGIREKEMLLITCGMINTKTWFFNLPEEITKNDKFGIVIIPEDIKRDLEKLDLSNPDHYLFGNLKSRSWNLSNQYLPSIIPMVRSSATRLWKKEIKDGLGINKDMYGLKHKGANDKRKNGMQIEAVSKLFRHSGTDITEIYATESNIILQEENRDKFGTFK